MTWASSVAFRLTLFGVPGSPRPNARRFPELVARCARQFADEMFAELPYLFRDHRKPMSAIVLSGVDAFASDVIKASRGVWSGLELARNLEALGWTLDIPKDVEDTLDDTDLEPFENWPMLVSSVEERAVKAWFRDNGGEILITEVTRARWNGVEGWAYPDRYYTQQGRVVFAPDAELIRFLDLKTGDIRGGKVAPAEEIEIDRSVVFPQISLAAA